MDFDYEIDRIYIVAGQSTNERATFEYYPRTIKSSFLDVINVEERGILFGGKKRRKRERKENYCRDKQYIE